MRAPRPILPRPDSRRLDVLVALAATLAAEAQALAGAAATGMVLVPALLAPAITLPVAVRRSHPAPVAVWGSVVITAQLAIWGDAQLVGETVAYLCALYGLAVWTDTRRFVTTTGLLAASTTPVAALGPDTTLAAALLFTTVMIVTMVIVRRVVGGRDERARIAEREREVLAREAVVAERARIASELHDAIAHNMSMVVMQAGAERRMLETGHGSPREVMRTIEDTGREALSEMRRLVGMLRADGDGDADGGQRLAPDPRLVDLPELVARRGAGTLTVHGPPRALPVSIELAAFRIVEETLAAGPVRVAIRYGPDELGIEIEPGTPATAAVRERVKLFGGQLEQGPTRLRVVLPVQ